MEDNHTQMVNKTMEADMKRSQGKVIVCKNCFGEHGIALENTTSMLAKMCLDLHGNPNRGDMEADASHMKYLWNAADGIPTEQAVKYLEYGAEMERALKCKVGACDNRDDTGGCPSDCGCPAFNVLLKMDVS